MIAAECFNNHHKELSCSASRNLLPIFHFPVCGIHKQFRKWVFGLYKHLVYLNTVTRQTHNTQHWPSGASRCTFIRVYCGDRMLYLCREPSAIYAVFRARWCIILAPVKLHLLSLKTPGQTGTSYKVVILQENGNWRQRERMKKRRDEINQPRSHL